MLKLIGVYFLKKIALNKFEKYLIARGTGKGLPKDVKNTRVGLLMKKIRELRQSGAFSDSVNPKLRLNPGLENAVKGGSKSKLSLKSKIEFE